MKTLRQSKTENTLVPTVNPLMLYANKTVKESSAIEIVATTEETMYNFEPSYIL